MFKHIETQRKLQDAASEALSLAILAGRSSFWHCDCMQVIGPHRQHQSSWVHGLSFFQEDTRNMGYRWLPYLPYCIVLLNQRTSLLAARRVQNDHWELLLDLRREWYSIKLDHTETHWNFEGHLVLSIWGVKRFHLDILYLVPQAAFMFLFSFRGERDWRSGRLASDLILLVVRFLSFWNTNVLLAVPKSPHPMTILNMAGGLTYPHYAIIIP
jgi:hypothetical protein